MAHYTLRFFKLITGIFFLHPSSQSDPIGAHAGKNQTPLSEITMPEIFSSFLKL